jgi:hypothetical protein
MLTKTAYVACTEQGGGCNVPLFRGVLHGLFAVTLVPLIVWCRRQHNPLYGALAKCAIVYSLQGIFSFAYHKVKTGLWGEKLLWVLDLAILPIHLNTFRLTNSGFMNVGWSVEVTMVLATLCCVLAVIFESTFAPFRVLVGVSFVQNVYFIPKETILIIAIMTISIGFVFYIHEYCADLSGSLPWFVSAFFLPRGKCIGEGMYTNHETFHVFLCAADAMFLYKMYTVAKRDGNASVVSSKIDSKKPLISGSSSNSEARASWHRKRKVIF